MAENSSTSNSDMKRFLVYVLSFLGVVLIVALSVDALNLYFVRHAAGISAGKIERLYNHPEPGEIPIFGSSVAKCGYVPTMIDKRCFNYAEDGASAWEMLNLLQVAIERDDTPAFIFNLDPWGLRGSEASIMQCDYSLVESYPCFRFYGKLKKNLAEWMNAKRGVTKVVDRGAVLIRQSRTADEWALMVRNWPKQGFSVSSICNTRLRELCKKLKGRKLIIVVTPCSQPWCNVYDGEEMLHRYISELTKIDGVEVIDLFTDKTLFTIDDFIDMTHLNINGARKFSQIVAAKILE